MLMARQLANPFPDHLLVVTAFWASLLFLGNGLVATPNAVTFATQFLGAIAVGSGVFLILGAEPPVLRHDPPFSRFPRPALAQLGDATEVAK